MVCDDSIVYAGVLSNNLQIFGDFSACINPHAWETQPLAKTHALCLSQVCNSHPLSPSSDHDHICLQCRFHDQLNNLNVIYSWYSLQTDNLLLNSPSNPFFLLAQICWLTVYFSKLKLKHSVYGIYHSICCDIGTSKAISTQLSVYATGFIVSYYYFVTATFKKTQSSHIIGPS